MPIIPIRNIGSSGISMDTPSVILPPSTWSNGRNIRFDNGSVAKIAGHTQYLGNLNEQDIHFGIYWPRPVTQYVIYANDSRVYRIDEAGNSSDISSAVAYSAGSRWHGSLFTGGYAVVMNNTVDTPQYIIYGTSGAAEETTLTNLPNWNYGSTTVTAGVLRPFKNVLVAGNLTDSVSGSLTRAPGTVRVSTRAAAGAIPTTWEPGALGDTSSADEFELSQTEPIVEMRELRGQLMIYTGDSIHSLNVTSSASNVRDINYGNGCLAINCVAEFEGKHLVVDRNDIYTHSGTGGITSVVDGKLRDYFFNNLHKTHFRNTFTTVNKSQDEVWICYPTLTANADGNCNEALIWNYRQNTWTIRDLPNVSHGFAAPSIANDAFQHSDEKLITVGEADTILYEMDTGTTFNGTNFTAFIERLNLDIGDLEASKWTSAIYPLIDGTGTVTIKAVADDTYGNAVNFSDRRAYSGTFKIGSDYKVDTRVNGRFASYRFESTDADSWRLAGFSFNTEASDRR